MADRLCSFDGGPLHMADRPVELDENGALPDIMVTDEGDFWSVYVHCPPHHWELPTYRYDGEANPREIDACPRVQAARGGERGE